LRVYGYPGLLYKINNMAEKALPTSKLTRLRNWLRIELGAADRPSDRRERTWVSTALACVVIFGLAAGVRALHWKDSHVMITRSTTSLMGVFNRYRKEADRILAEGSILFPSQQPAPGDARMLAHPPGYSILLAGIKWWSSRVYESLWLIQIAADGLAAVLIFLIASELFRPRIGFIAGTLVAVCPQLAYYCLLLTPDSLAALLVVTSVYFLVLAVKRPRLIYMICSGCAIGLSCWLGANGMGLVLFLGLLAYALLARQNRTRYSVALLGAGTLMIAPITIRNLIAYHRFIPISIQAGLSLAEGIGDFDRQGKLGMPRSDEEARVKDVEWSGKDEYGSSLWYPDGIERDQVRLSHALAVVRARPVWFLGVMLRRAALMLRYNDSAAYGWPQDSSVVGMIQTQVPFSRELAFEPRQTADPAINKVLVYQGQVLDEAAAIPSETAPVWSASPSELLASGQPLSAGARAGLQENGEVLAITGDRSNYDNQFASELIRVEPHTDYILTIRVAPSHSTMAVKVASPDMKIAVASASIEEAVFAAANTKVGPRNPEGSERPQALSELDVQIPFASGPRTGVYTIFSNNGQGTGSAALAVRGARLVAIGPTGGHITRLPRIVIHFLQKVLFTTSHMLVLIFAGLASCAIATKWRSLVLVVAVPFYYLAAQSLLHTEYRYVLSIHYFVLIAAAVTLSCAVSCCSELARVLAPRLTHRIGTLKREPALAQEHVED
jgi:hypothetical protein